jgi:hypothetical protein
VKNITTVPARDGVLAEFWMLIATQAPDQFDYPAGPKKLGNSFILETS